MKIQIWKRKNKTKNKNYIYIRYRFSQKKANVESLNLWEWVSPKTKIEKQHNKEVQLSFLETKRRKQDDYENKRLIIENRQEIKAYFKKVFFEFCYQKNAKSVYNILKNCDSKIDYYKLHEVVNKQYLQSIKEKLENITTIKKSTIKKYWESLKSALIKAHKESLCEYPNMEKIKLSTLSQNKKYYSEKELNQLYKTTPDNWEDIKNAFFFACYTGLSLGELYSLRWENIKSKKIINKTVYYYCIYNEIKNSYKKNSFPKKAMIYLGKEKKISDKIFNLPEKISNRSKVFKLWKQKSGIMNDKTFHDSRHTFAYKIYKETKNIYLVAETLGHNNIEITKTYYQDMDNNNFYNNAKYIKYDYNKKFKNKSTNIKPLRKKNVFKHGNLLSYKNLGYI